MSFLFDKRTKKTMKWVWVLFSVMIILSMTLVFSGGHGLFGANAGGNYSTPSPSRNALPPAEDLIIPPSSPATEEPILESPSDGQAAGSDSMLLDHSN